MGQSVNKMCSCGAKTPGPVLKDRGLAPDMDLSFGFIPGFTPVHMLVCAIDYKGTSAPLTCTQDADNIIQAARAANITDITYIRDNQCTRDGVLGKIKEVGSKCKSGEYFVFFYAGHGANIPDDDGDEPDGKDEALCTVTETGDIDFSQFVRDDDFATAVTDVCEQGTKILIMCDCCHSGTIGDFGSPCWEGHTAVSMSGCKDHQTSGDTGRGGIWTHSCLIAIQALLEEGKTSFSCAQLYNMQLKKDDAVFNSAQDIELYWTPDLDGAEGMAWPLIPQTGYIAPWNFMTPTQRALR
mmetsp:Transcript_69440/g.123748  ORF Transcript_69440/g.123748 Transcript_69440/m.123748 type:complete len:297 (+) Transcript_69440:69-959(+)